MQQDSDLTVNDQKKTRRKKVEMTAERQALADECKADFEKFVRYLQPKRVVANCHTELMLFLTNSSAKSHQLILYPRDHGKSTYAGLYVAWLLTGNPALRILYISSTSNLAIKQLKFIKDILTSENYRRLWPEMVNQEEALREKWTEKEISIDHPKRKEEYIRDPSIFTAGLTTNVVGMHCDVSILDDVVVANNAYSEEGRERVREQYGYLSSVEGAESRQVVVGTRYHPLDLYSNLVEKEIHSYDELGSIVSTEKLFETLEKQVESIGDGTGEFLWPRQQRYDGQWFGFDSKILAKKKSAYDNQTHFRAQYYNDPHDLDSSSIKRELFQYYDERYLTQKDGKWYFKGNPINVVAAVDFAYTTGRKSDASCIAVVGSDTYNNYYILELDRFKTDKISEYFTHILSLHNKWGFRKLRAEVSAAQSVIVKDLRENYIKPHGLSLAVEDFRPSRWIGSKEERISATLEPKYSNRQIWHYRSGNCQLLEEELMFANPSHDDIKDALASAIDFVVPPMNYYRIKKESTNVFQFNNQFGGVA